MKSHRIGRKIYSIEYIRIAIVGADARKWHSDDIPKVKDTIRGIIERNSLKGEVMIVSGGCPYGGVDIWTEEIADILDLNKEIFKPGVNRWNDAGKKKGYKSRNIMIAESCDILYDIEPRYKRSGGTWTLEYAKSIGKEVYKIEV